MIDAAVEHDPSVEYANELLDKLLKYFTLTEIASYSGISRRNLSYLRHRGIGNYPMQLTLEVLASSADQ